MPHTVSPATDRDPLVIEQLFPGYQVQVDEERPDHRFQQLTFSMMI